MELKIGKLDSDLLKEIVFGAIKHKREEVLARPGIGEDCAVIDFGDEVCVMSTDPITAAINDIGKLAVHISCNDIASNGIEPLGIMLAIMVPEGTTSEQIKEIMNQASEEAAKLKVEIIGGHTEITDAVNKPIIVSTAIGKGKKANSMIKEEPKEGDALLMTKTAGLEGTGIIASEKEEELKTILTYEEITKAKNLLHDLSVVTEGVIAGKIGVSAMHDVTEGGILGAIWEICECANLGVDVDGSKIPVEDVTVKICDHYNLDYLKLISSGSMVIAVSQNKKENLIEEIKKSNIEVTEVGILTNSERRMLIKGKYVEIATPESDELYKV